MLLRVQGIVVVEQAERAVELEAGRIRSQIVVVNAGGVAELEAFVLVGPDENRFLENWIEFDFELPEVLLDNRFQLELELEAGAWPLLDAQAQLALG